MVVFTHVYACIYLSVIYLLINQIYPRSVYLDIHPSIYLLSTYLFIYLSIIYLSTNIVYNSPTNLIYQLFIYLSLYHLTIKLIYHLSLSTIPVSLSDICLSAISLESYGSFSHHNSIKERADLLTFHVLMLGQKDISSE